jgi:hypothetical protein
VVIDRKRSKQLAGGMAQVLESLHMALSSNPSTSIKRNKQISDDKVE